MAFSFFTFINVKPANKLSGVSFTDVILGYCVRQWRRAHAQ